MWLKAVNADERKLYDRVNSRVHTATEKHSTNLARFAHKVYTHKRKLITTLMMTTLVQLNCHL